MPNRRLFSIASKLILFIGGLLVLVIAVITIQGTQIFTEFSSQREEDSLADVASSIAGEVDIFYSSIVSQTQLLAGMMLSQKQDPKAREEFLRLSFFQDHEILSLEIDQDRGQGPVRVDRVLQTSQMNSLHLAPDFVDEIREIHKIDFNMAQLGQVQILNGSLPEGTAISTVVLPLVKDRSGRVTHFAIADFRIDQLQKTLKQIRSRGVVIVDPKGQVLLSGKDRDTVETSSVENSPLWEALQKTKGRLGQMAFVEPSTHREMVGSYARSSFGIVTLMQVEMGRIQRVAEAVRRRTVVVGGYVMAAMVLAVMFFSLLFTRPIEKLVELTKEVAKGNFNLKSGVKTNDEVGELAESIDQMLGGLQERDKMKNALTKFHGSSVAEDMIKGQIQLGGTRKIVTIFFSDLRGFTKISEGQSPESVVEMLNEYFTIMVKIITSNHGIVDKFVGDAIMAVWGSPQSTGQDPQFAVKACLEMRIALAKLNERRIGRGQLPIMMGMGLHTGEVISGNIGSDERMEFTVIGDTVNLASRVESTTKVFGTDLLVTDAVSKAVGDDFLMSPVGSVEIKGKSQPLQLYKVEGQKGPDGKIQIVQTQYSSYAPEESDKVKAT